MGNNDVKKSSNRASVNGSQNAASASSKNSDISGAGQRRCKRWIRRLLGREFDAILIKAQSRIKLLSHRINAKNKIIISGAVEVVLTERCTLKCTSCSNLMQYYQEPKSMPLAQVCRDLDIFFGSVDFVYIVRLIGGEPLMVKELPLILKHLAKHKHKFGQIMITTNGTVIPPEDALRVLKKYRVQLLLSDYGEKSVNLQRLAAELKSRKIPYNIYQPIWRAMQQIVDGSERTEADVQSVFNDCTIKCTTLLNGRFYRCPFLAHGDALLVFPNKAENYADLLGSESPRAAMKEYLFPDNVPPGCRFCSGSDESLPEVPVAEQIKHPMPIPRF